MGFLFGSGIGAPTYNAAQGLPGFTQTGNPAELNNATAGAQGALTQQQSFLNALGVNGLNGTQQGVFNQQQGLANQFQQVANGQGPNPAQAQLAQNTGQNIQQQAALMASARGGQSNPGLIARQAGQVGAQAQQQSVGQAATLGAQQQMTGMQNLAAQQGQMANLATAGVGQQQTGLGTFGSQTQGEQNILQNAITNQNAQQVQAQGNNVDLYKTGMQNSAGAAGGLLGGVASAGLGLLGLDRGGIVPHYYEGKGLSGPSDSNPTDIQQNMSKNGPQSLLAQSGSGFQNMGNQNFGNAGANQLGSGLTSFGNGIGTAIGAAFAPASNNATEEDVSNVMSEVPTGTVGSGAALASAIGMPGYNNEAHGGVVPSMVSPGEIYLNHSAVDEVKKGANPKSVGEKIPGKAKVKGDSPKNDTVHKDLEGGGVVIPRSHSQDPEKIASFLNGLLGTNFQNVKSKEKAA